MKKQDFYFAGAIILFFLPFFIFQPLYDFYKVFNAEHPFIISFIKFAILSTLGEVIGLRIRTGQYHQRGFGLLPRALVWGFLGIGIKMSFIIFGTGAPHILTTLGFQFPTDNPADILNQNFFATFSWLQLLTAFTVSITMNTFFAPIFMSFHKITDTHILATGGTLRGFFTPIPMATIMQNMNWSVQWNFEIGRASCRERV